MRIENNKLIFLTVEELIGKIESVITEYGILKDSKIKILGHNLIYRSSIVWLMLEDIRSEISIEEYEDLFNRFKRIEQQVYDNKYLEIS